MEEQNIKIGFTYTNEFGHTYSATNCDDLLCDETEWEHIARHLSSFLKQIGFSIKGDYLLMEDVTEDEYCAVKEFLDDYRTNNAEKCE